MSDAAKKSVSTRQRKQYGESIAIELASNGSAVEDGSTEREDSPDVRQRDRRTAVACATLTVEEAAEYIGISRTSAYLAVRRGDIKATRIGRRWIVTFAALRDRLQLQEQDPWI